jgi:hypothetical protein
MWVDDQIHGLCQRAVRICDVQAVHVLSSWKNGVFKGACKKVMRRVSRTGATVHRSVTVGYQGTYLTRKEEDRWYRKMTPEIPHFNKSTTPSANLCINHGWTFATHLEKVQLKNWFKAGERHFRANCTRCPELDTGHPFGIFKVCMMPTIKDLSYNIYPHAAGSVCGSCIDEDRELDTEVAEVCGIDPGEVCSAQRYCGCLRLRANRGVKYVYARKYDEDGAPPHKRWNEVTTHTHTVLPCYRGGKSGYVTVADVIHPKFPRLRNTLVDPRVVLP